MTDQHIRALERHGGHHKHTFQFIHAAHASVPVSELEALANDPAVVRITPDRPVEGSLDHSTSVVDYNPLAGYLGSLNQAKGGGVGIVVIDSGIAPQYNFDGFLNSSYNRIVDAESLIDNDPVDRYGHGTHVAGIAAGMDNVTASMGYAKRAFWGIAPDASIISLKVLNSQGVGSDSSVIAGIIARLR